MASGQSPTVQRFLRAPIFAVGLVAVWALLSGCASKESTAPGSDLLSSGRGDASSVAPVADFDAYVAQSPPPGEAGARATFNPHSPDLERRIAEFLNQVDGRHREASGTHRSRP